MTAILMLSLLSIACKSHERYEGKVSAWPTGWRLIRNVRILGFISEYLRKRWKVGRKSPRAICYAFQLPIRGIQGKQQFCLKPFPMISNDFKEIEVIQPIGVKPNAKGANPHLAEQEILLRQNRASREFESCSLFLKQDSLPQRAFMVIWGGNLVMMNVVLCIISCYTDRLLDLCTAPWRSRYYRMRRL